MRTQTRQSSELVADAFDDDGAVVGDGLGGELLVGQVAHDVFGGEGVEVVVAGEAKEGDGARGVAEFADEGADATAEFERAAGLIAMPEGHFAGFARGGRDEDAVVGDLVDAPGGRAEDEGFAGAGFKDHLLIEFADANGAVALAGEEDAEGAAVGDGAAVEDGDLFDAGAGGDPLAGAGSQVTRGRSSPNSSEG